MQVIVLAGGEGKRMKSTVPKVLHKVGDKSMLERVIDASCAVGSEKTRIYVVAGKNEEIFRSELGERDNIYYVPQIPPRGTGHAVSECLPYLSREIDGDFPVLIVNGDTPLLGECLHEMVKTCAPPSFMVTHLENPVGQGRVITDEHGHFVKIVEEKDATPAEREINLVNCGIYYMNKKHLDKTIPNLSCDNAQNEYYITDICEMLKNDITLFELRKNDQWQVMNVNTPEELEKANNLFKDLIGSD